MRNPRINVTFDQSDLEVMQILCKSKKISLSKLIRKVMEDWLEDYEDMLLAKRAEEAERLWELNGRKTISHEELCQELGIESNIQNIQKPISKSSQKTSKKGSFVRSNKGYSSRQKPANL